MQTPDIVARAKQYFVPGQLEQTAPRIREANVVDLDQCLVNYPLALMDARVLYPTLKESDLEWMVGALGFSIEFMGLLDVKLLLRKYPEIFVFSSLCCWAFDRQYPTHDTYYAQRQYNTVVNTLLAVGYSVDECRAVIDDFHLPPPVKSLLHQQFNSLLGEGPQVVYPLNAKAQKATVH